MTSPRVPRPLLRASGFGAVALALTVAACRAPEPDVALPSAPPARSVGPAPVDAATTERTAREALARHYPQLARGVGDSATVVLVFDPKGTLVDHRLTVRGQTPPPPRTPSSPSLSGMLDMVQFRPGELGPDPVRVFTLRQLSPEAAAASRARADAETVIVTTAPTTAAQGAGR